MRLAGDKEHDEHLGKLVNMLGEGAVFGETALAEDELEGIRGASVKTATFVELEVLNRDAYIKVSHEHDEVRKHVEEHLRSLKMRRTGTQRLKTKVAEPWMQKPHVPLDRLSSVLGSLAFEGQQDVGSDRAAPAPAAALQVSRADT